MTQLGRYVAWSALWQITLFRKGECLCSTFRIRKSASFPHPQFITLFIFHFPVSNVACGFSDWVQLKRFPLTNFVKSRVRANFQHVFLVKIKIPELLQIRSSTLYFWLLNCPYCAVSSEWETENMVSTITNN